MRGILLAAILSISASLAAAQEVLSPDPDIEATIAGQFAAFVAEDVDGAFQFASPNIQRLFRSPENFAQMVEQGYPMVWAPGSVSFVDLQQLGSVIVQRVEVVDGAGRAYMLGYQMIETDAGWRINGVQVLQGTGIGA